MATAFVLPPPLLAPTRVPASDPCPGAPRLSCIELFDELNLPEPPTMDDTGSVAGSASCPTIESTESLAGSSRASLRTVDMGRTALSSEGRCDGEAVVTGEIMYDRMRAMGVEFPNALGLMERGEEVLASAEPGTPASVASPRSPKAGMFNRSKFLDRMLTLVQRRKADIAHAASSVESAPPKPPAKDHSKPRGTPATELLVNAGLSHAMKNALRISFNIDTTRSNASMATPELTPGVISPTDQVIQTPTASRQRTPDYCFPPLPNKGGPRLEAFWSGDIAGTASPLDRLMADAQAARQRLAKSTKALPDHIDRALPSSPPRLKAPMLSSTCALLASPHLTTILEGSEAPIRFASSAPSSIIVRKVGSPDLRARARTGAGGENVPSPSSSASSVPSIIVTDHSGAGSPVLTGWLLASSLLPGAQVLPEDDELDREFRMSTHDEPDALVVAAAARSDTAYSLFWRVLGAFAGQLDLSLMTILRLPAVVYAFERADCSVDEYLGVLRAAQRLDRADAMVPLEARRFKNGGDHLQRWNGTTFYCALTLLVPEVTDFENLAALPVQIRAAVQLLMAFREWDRGAEDFIRTLRHDHSRYPIFPIVPPGGCVHDAA